MGPAKVPPPPQLQNALSVSSHPTFPTPARISPTSPNDTLNSETACDDTLSSSIVWKNGPLMRRATNALKSRWLRTLVVGTAAAGFTMIAWLLTHW